IRFLRLFVAQMSDRSFLIDTRLREIQITGNAGDKHILLYAPREQARGLPNDTWIVAAGIDHGIPRFALQRFQTAISVPSYLFYLGKKAGIMEASIEEGHLMSAR